MSSFVNHQIFAVTEVIGWLFHTETEEIIKFIIFVSPYFSEIYCVILFLVPKQNGAIIATTLQFCVSGMLILLNGL